MPITPNQLAELIAGNRRVGGTMLPEATMLEILDDLRAACEERDRLRAQYKALHSQVSGYLHGEDWEHWQKYNAPRFQLEADQQIIERIRAVARDHGWAIGVHGSLVRDIDLIGVPWSAGRCPPDELVSAIISGTGYETKGDKLSPRRHAGGRQSVLLFAPDATWKEGDDKKGWWNPKAIDLSLICLTDTEINIEAERRPTVTRPPMRSAEVFSTDPLAQRTVLYPPTSEDWEKAIRAAGIEIGEGT